MVRHSVKRKFEMLARDQLDLALDQWELEPELFTSDFDDDLDVLGDMIDGLHEFRYIEPRFQGSAGYIDTGSAQLPLGQIMALPWDTFLQRMRMSRPNFDDLVILLKSSATDDHWCQNHRPPARPVEQQVAAALFVLGSPLSLESHRGTLGISKGALQLYLWRTVQALVELSPEFIQWPSEELRARWKRYGRAHNAPFKNCIGFVDGSEIQLRNKPEVRNYQRYFSKKKRYGFNLQAICSFEKRILYANAQSLASCHDSTAFKDTALYQRRREFFCPGEYLLGDKAYGLDPFMITPFKGAQARGEREKAFNLAHATERVAIEHTFGVLKARWQSLRSLPLRIRRGKEPEDQKRIGDWIHACLVLHNFLHDRNEDQEWLQDAIEALAAEEDDHTGQEASGMNEEETAHLATQDARREQAIGRRMRDLLADQIFEE